MKYDKSMNLDPKNKLFYHLPWAFLLFILIVSQSKASKPIGVQPNPIPVNGTFIIPPGFLFAPFPSAACINAANLPTSDSLTALQLAYSPSRGEEPQNIYSGIATSTKSFGFGFGYFGSLGDFKTTNGGFVGLGFKSDSSQYGISYRNQDLSSSGKADFDLSYVYVDTREGLSYGGVLRSVNTSPQLNLGLGYASSRFFNIEFNVNAPKASNLGHGDFILIGASNFSIAEKMTAHLQGNFHTQTSKLDALVAYNYWISDFADAILQFSSPNVWSFGFSAVF
ncbi:MAG: hypothetical protein ACKOA8_11315 [Deltaproteobacteria bacterium]